MSTVKTFPAIIAGRTDFMFPVEAYERHTGKTLPSPSGDEHWSEAVLQDLQHFAIHAMLEAEKMIKVGFTPEGLGGLVMEAGYTVYLGVPHVVTTFYADEIPVTLTSVPRAKIVPFQKGNA